MIAKLGLSQRDRRTLVVGFYTVVTLFTVARGLPALRAWEADRKAEAQSAAQQLASLRSGLRTLPALRDSLRARRARLVVLDSTLLSGSSPAAVAANLASTLEDIADDNSIKVTAMQLRADTVASAGLARVEVRVTGVTDIAGLARFLHAVEADETPLVVRDVNVSQPEPWGSDSKPETLRIDVLIATIGTLNTDNPVFRR